MDERIHWMEWGKEAFEKAKNEDKPILLDISAVWCHWCYRMDQDTYSSYEVSKIINEKFVPIRVDTDKRPDINERYNQGGWPTTVFLTPEGKTLFGGTYFPSRDFESLLMQVIDYYKERGRRPLESEFEMRVKLFQERMKGKEISEEIVSNVLSNIVSDFDFEYGGVGHEPKFPFTDSLELQFLEFLRKKDSKYLKMAETTLNGMLNGLYDKEEGGFFRYSTMRDWSEPHYEKLLKVNADLILAYLQGYVLLNDQRFREVAEKTIEYVLKSLKNNDRAFYGSQNADEQYYKLSLEQRTQHNKPSVDKTFYTDSNCAVVSALLFASHVLDRDDLKFIAIETADFMLSNFKDGKLYCHYFDGKRNFSDLLADQAFILRMLLDLYEYTNEWKYLEEAEQLAESISKVFWDKEGGFWDRVDAEELGELKKRYKPLLENSIVADCLIRLHYLTLKEGYIKTAESCLSIFAGSYDMHGLSSGTYALAVARFLSPTLIDIVGHNNDQKLQALWKTALKVYDSRRIVILLDPNSMIFKKKGYPFEGSAYLQFCRNGVCERPIKEAAVVK